MKNFLNETLTAHRPIGVSSTSKLLKNYPFKVIKNLSNSVSTLVKEKEISNKSSLDRIRIVVDSFVEGVDINDLCARERISRETFYKWRQEFLRGFGLYAEDYLNKKHNQNLSKEFVINETGSEEVYDFYNKYVNFGLNNTLILGKNRKLSAYSELNAIKNILVFTRMNDFRLINKHLEEVNAKLSNGGLLLGCFETFTARSNRRKVNNISFVKNVVSIFDFTIHRVCPKLPYVKKVYFNITKGKNRLLSKAEALGRLVSCGFDIVDFTEINGLNYFVVKKVKQPAFNMNPSYGPLFKMQRLGKNGKMIGVYKFRTMHPYSEYLQDYVLSVNGYAENGKPADDFRVVPWAKFLRRYWLDELPQLINVLKGDLKLIGIRPVSQRFFNDIPQDIQEMRIKQKPGCIPPYVALDRKSSVEGVLQAEREYLIEKSKNPYFTDTKFFFKAIYNILIKRKRSA